MIYKSFRVNRSFVSLSALDFQTGDPGDFQTADPGVHLGFLIEIILATFDLQAALIFPIKFRLYWPFCSGEEVQNIYF